MENENRKREFIKETLVPPKKIRRVLLVVLAVTGAGLLFGLVAGATFALSRNILTEEDPGQSKAAIIIARDDETIKETRRYPDISVQPEDDETAEPTAQTGSESESGSEAESESGTSDETKEAGSERESMEETEEPKTRTEAKTVFDSVRSSFTILSGANDYLNGSTEAKPQSVGVFVAETDESILILAGNEVFSEADTLYARIGEKAVPTELVGQDRRTGLVVLQISKQDVETEISVITLGNSYLASVGERVFMIGSPDLRAISIDEGLITYIEKEESETDGFLQHFYTDMERSVHGTAALLNEAGELIGWVSDYACSDGTDANAAGISPLKYLIEDLCTGNPTAYLGIRCISIRDVDAEKSGVPEGYYVIEVEENSPAYQAGIQPGDRLVGINHLSAGSGQFLVKRMDGMEAGETVNITLIRRSGEGYVTLLLEATAGVRE